MFPSISMQNTDDFRQMVRRFVENEINPHVEKWEEATHFPGARAFQKSRRFGAFGHHLPGRIWRQWPGLLV